MDLSHTLIQCVDHSSIAPAKDWWEVHTVSSCAPTCLCWYFLAVDSAKRADSRHSTISFIKCYIHLLFT